MISFVIPTYNCIWLPQAVDSVLKQTVKDWELVIVNDGSTDSTADYLNWLKKQKHNIKMVTMKPNQGCSKSRNMGNTVANGTHIFVLDADDEALPKRIELTMKKFKDGVQFVYGGAVVMDCLENKINDIVPDVFSLEKALKLGQNGIVHSTVAYTKEFSERYSHPVGKYSELGIDDWTQQIEAACDGVKFDFTPHQIAGHRILKTSTTANRDNKEVVKAKNEFIQTLRVPA